MISIIILTKNEEMDLPGCLQSLAWSDDIHVLDSGSVDKTIDIARQYKAKVWHNPFESFGRQRNYALKHITTIYPWVLFLDADEIVTEKFRADLLKSVTSANDDVAGFYCCWKMMLEGRWLKYCDNFPKWQFRLVRKGKANFTDFGHGQKEGDVVGRIDYIKEPYVHNGFSKGWKQWIERHNRYSDQEAKDRLYNQKPFKNIFARHSSVRNPALKSRLSRIPGWPIIRFLQSYFLNLGFLEGRQGFVYCINMAYYEFLIQLKIRELTTASRISINYTAVEYNEVR